MIKSTIISNPIIIFPLMMNLFMILMLMNHSINNLHPIMFLITLIILTLIISMKMNYFYKSLLPFILFLTMIGGLLIMYMYIVSLINNKMFNIKFNSIKLNFIKITPIMIIMMMLFYYNYTYLNMISLNFINLFEKLNMNFLYKNFYNKSTIFIMIYLFYTLIIIMNICLMYKSPLRQISYYE